MSEVIPFPKNETVEHTCGPEVGLNAWACAYCTEQFAFYVLPEGVYCWECHAPQVFP